MPGNAIAAGRGFDALKAAFFDRQKVKDAVDKASLRIMSKFGAFVRQRAKTSMRYSDKPSRPGQPPSAHRSGRISKRGRDGVKKVQSVSPLREFLFFAYDHAAGGTVVGPAKTNQVFFDRDRRPVTGTVPAVLEYGGAITVLEVFKWGKWRRMNLVSKRRNEGLPTRYRTVNIAKRPFMRPALEAEQPKFAPMFKNAVLAAGAK